MRTYLIHYDKLKERKKFMKSQLEAQKMKVDWFIQKESEPYSENEISKYYKYDKNDWIRKVKKGERNIIPRPLGIHEICLTVNHFKIMKKIAENKEDYALVLEDDVILTKDFLKKLSHIQKLLKKKSWDMVFLDWCGVIPPAVKNPVLVGREKDRDPWGTGAYLIKKTAAKKIMKNFKRFTLVIDEELRYLSKELGLKILWTNPPLTKQGSVYGKFDSTLTEDRETTGIKKYLGWRKKIYSMLEKNTVWRRLVLLIRKIEGRIKKSIIR